MPHIRINLASVTDLITLPGVSYTLANRIVKFRHTRTITADNIHHISHLKITTPLLNAISFDTEPPPHSSGSITMAEPNNRRRSGSPSSDGNASAVSGGAATRSRTRRRSPPRNIHGMNNAGFQRHGHISTKGPSHSTHHSVRRVSVSSQDSDSDDSTYPRQGNRHGRRDNSFRPPPRELDYDGKSDWTPFYRRFTSYAVEKDWSGTTSLTNLGWCLKGKASDFYNRILDREPSIDYTRMMHKLVKRFGDREVLDMAIMKFSQAHQENGEEILEWADRVQHLAHRAYKHLERGKEEQMAIMRFGQGLLDKRLAEYISNANISSMEKAIDRTQTFQHNSVAIHGSAGSSSVSSQQQRSQGPAVRINAVGRPSRYEQPARSNLAFHLRSRTPTKSPESSPANSLSGQGKGGLRQTNAGLGAPSLAGMDTKLDKLTGMNAKLDEVVSGISGS
ncbi:uncharacterized protein [Procambarus clarkii]|uniref:uncharacterized protein isoform X1 n=1 Tax=Procambarus clarkii TaxID=6728 RepID=UPI003743F6AF